MNTYLTTFLDRAARFTDVVSAVPNDRLGIRESIIGRLERAGGQAVLRSGPNGTEWELRLPRADGLGVRQ
jgi:hypothetical protein